jgi:hypothetical protein
MPVLLRDPPSAGGGRPPIPRSPWGLWRPPLIAPEPIYREAEAFAATQAQSATLAKVIQRSLESTQPQAPTRIARPTRLLSAKQYQLGVGHAQNYVANPSFEYDTAGTHTPAAWSTSSSSIKLGATVTVEAGEAAEGLQYLSVACAGEHSHEGAISEESIPVEAGVPQQGYLWVKGPAGKQIEVVIGSVSQGFTGEIKTLTGAWEQVESAEFTPSASGYIALGVRSANDEVLTFSIDGASTTQVYFDGSYPGAWWAGTPGDSQSTFSGSLLARAPTRLLGPTQAQVPAFAKIVKRALSATQAQVPTLLKTPKRLLSATQAQVASLVRAPLRLLSTVQAQVATKTRTPARLLSATQAQASTRVTTPRRSLSTTQGQAATAPKTPKRLLGATQTQASTKLTTPTRLLGASQAQAATRATTLARLLSATQAELASLKRALTRGLTATQPQAATLLKTPARHLTATQAQTATRTVALSRGFVATQTQLVGVARRFVSTHSATQAQTAALKRSPSRSMSATQTQLVGVARAPSRHLSSTQPQLVIVRRWRPEDAEPIAVTTVLLWPAPVTSVIVAPEETVSVVVEQAETTTVVL